jgi:acetyl-CoA synthetase
MSDATQYIWTPPPDLVAQSNLTAFLRATGRQDYDDLAAKADADPAWLMEQVFKFCDVRFYRRHDAMLDLSRGQPWARWCVGGTTNIVLNCIDKHRGTPVWDQTFLVWEGEDKRQRRSLARSGGWRRGCAISALSGRTWSRSTCRTCRRRSLPSSRR